MRASTVDKKNGGMVVRLYRPSDLNALYELDRLCFRSPFRFSLRAMRRFAIAPNSLTLVAETTASQIAGFIITHRETRRSETAGYVVTLDVHPALARSGIATQLMREAESEGAAQGESVMCLHVYIGNAAAISFYESLSYRRWEIIQNFYGAGLHAYPYEKAIDCLSSPKGEADESA